MLSQPGLDDGAQDPALPACPPASICPKPTWHAWKDRTGIAIIDGIGATEMMHIFISASGDDIRPGSTGKAVPGYEATVLDEDGQPMDEGTGRLAIKGPTGCRYLDDPRQARLCRRWLERHRRHLPPDADGYFWYLARSDDMIVSSGYNIGAPEVENALLAHPAVAECAVIGVPCAERGQKVKAFVVLADFAEPSDELVAELKAFVKEQIAPYKYPREIEFVDALPKTATGKLRRSELRNASAIDAEPSTWQSAACSVPRLAGCRAERLGLESWIMRKPTCVKLADECVPRRPVCGSQLIMASSHELPCATQLSRLLKLHDHLIDREAVAGLDRRRLDRRRLLGAQDFSIFIASITATGWPASTLSPTLTSSRVSSPGIGAISSRDRSGGTFSIMCRDSSATCGGSTCTLCAGAARRAAPSRGRCGATWTMRVPPVDARPTAAAGPAPSRPIDVDQLAAVDDRERAAVIGLDARRDARARRSCTTRSRRQRDRRRPAGRRSRPRARRCVSCDHRGDRGEVARSAARRPARRGSRRDIPRR